MKATEEELSEHIVSLYITLLEIISKELSEDFPLVWRSKRSENGFFQKSHFSLGVGTDPGEMIVYTIPGQWWDRCDFAVDLQRRPVSDLATSDDIIHRVNNLYRKSKEKWS